MARDALGHIRQAIRMLSGGMYVSSYETQIIEKLMEAESILVGDESILVRFNVTRKDLLELLASDAYADIENAGERSTVELFTLVVQDALYDSANGPQLSGDFDIVKEAAHE